jgi:transposase-like protein
VSILATEYNQEAHVRVRLEELVEEVAKKMLLKGYPIGSISEVVGLSESGVSSLQREFSYS